MIFDASSDASVGSLCNDGFLISWLRLLVAFISDVVKLD